MENWLDTKKRRFDIGDEERVDIFQPSLWCTLSALLIITLCSRSSFLYAFNIWDDANSYFTMGRSMLRGMVPYRDLFDQKGIILYTIYALSSLISPTTFWGVYLFEILAAFLSLLALFFVLRLYLGKGILSYLLTTICGAVIYSSVSFYWGGSAEEFLFPCICWGLYISLKYFRTRYPEPMSYRTVLLGGVLAGVVFHIKFNSLGFFFAWMAMVFFADIIGEVKVAKAFISCLVFIFGMVLVTIPGVIYFGINGAIGDWAYVYLYKNIFEYSKSLSIAERFAAIYDIMTDHMYSNPICYLLIFIGAVYFTVALISKWIKEDKHRIIKKSAFLLDLSLFEYINIAMLLGFLVLVIFAGGVTLLYYPFPINAFVVFGAAAIGKLLRGVWRLFLWNRGRKESEMTLDLSRSATIILLIMALLVGGIMSWNLSMNTKSMGLSKEELWLYKFRDYVLSSGVENPKLLNMHGFDMGLYTVTNSDPVCYYYQTQTLNMDEVLEYQYSFIHDKKVDFVLTCKEETPENIKGYVLVMQDSIDIYRYSRDYYLYEREDLIATE